MPCLIKQTKAHETPPLSVYVLCCQMFLARPWSSPSRVEGVLLLNALVAGSLMASAIFFSNDPGRPDQYLVISVLSTLISTVPPEIFQVMLSSVQALDRRRAAGRADKSNKMMWRDGVWEQRADRPKISAPSRASRTTDHDSNLEPRLASKGWRGERVATLMYSVVCAHKAARTIVRRVRRQTMSKRVTQTAGWIALRALGVTPPPAMSVFGKEEIPISYLQLPARASIVVRTLILLYSCM